MVGVQEHLVVQEQRVEVWLQVFQQLHHKVAEEVEEKLQVLKEVNLVVLVVAVALALL